MSYQFTVTVSDQHPLTGNTRSWSRIFDESVEMRRVITWARNVTGDEFTLISDLTFSEFTGTSI